MIAVTPVPVNMEVGKLAACHSAIVPKKVKATKQEDFSKQFSPSEVTLWGKVKEVRPD
jgi:hypothetical protein